MQSSTIKNKECRTLNYNVSISILDSKNSQCITVKEANASFEYITRMALGRSFLHLKDVRVLLSEK